MTQHEFAPAGSSNAVCQKCGLVRQLAPTMNGHEHHGLLVTRPGLDIRYAERYFPCVHPGDTKDGRAVIVPFRWDGLPFWNEPAETWHGEGGGA